MIGKCFEIKELIELTFFAVVRVVMCVKNEELGEAMLLKAAIVEKGSPLG